MIVKVMYFGQPFVTFVMIYCQLVTPFSIIQVSTAVYNVNNHQICFVAVTCKMLHM